MPTRSWRTSKRSVVLAVLIVAVLAVVGILAIRAVSGPNSPSEPPGAAGPGPPASGCTAPAGAQQQDVDQRDSPEKPWQRPPSQKAVVYFDNQGTQGRYWNMVTTATDIWSRSACIHAVAMSTAPEDVNSVGVTEGPLRPARSHTDAEFSGNDRGQYRTGGTITLYTKVLANESDNGALATIVHEMGHALGLVHRNNKNDVMNATTSDHTNPVPDDVDFANLIVIYGKNG